MKSASAEWRAPLAGDLEPLLAARVVRERLQEPGGVGLRDLVAGLGEARVAEALRVGEHHRHAQED